MPRPSRFPLVLALLAAPAAAAESTPVTIAFDQDVYQAGTHAELTVSGAPGTLVWLGFDFDPGPTFIPGFGTFDLGFSSSFNFALLPAIPASGELVLTWQCTSPCVNPITGNDLYVQGVAPDPLTLAFCLTNPEVLNVEDLSGMCNTCLVIIDEETIDNDIKSIEAAAASHGIASDLLVNDDQPTEVGNPPLRWNELFAGDVVLLPGGQVDDEGWFALPPDAPFKVQGYAAGTIPQSQLDKIADVMPIRNQELAKLVGLKCVAVVYDSDISMNYLPINANLQGARYGLFTFTVLDVVLAGTLAESKSDTSLYDLLVRVEEPATPGVSFNVPIHDHEPDAIRILEATFSGGMVHVVGDSDFGAGSLMTVSIDGFVLEAPMVSLGDGRFEYLAASETDLAGRRVTISTDHGGAYNDFITD